MSNEGGTGTELEFTWDPAKAISNLAKHGVAFAQAATVFADALALTVFDNEHSNFEERRFTLGLDRAGKLLAVSHTYAATGPASARVGVRVRVRVILAREATRRTSAGSTRTSRAEPGSAVADQQLNQQGDDDGNASQPARRLER